MEAWTMSSRPISAKTKRFIEAQRPWYIVERRFIKCSHRWHFIGWESEIDFLYARDEGIASVS